ncbi:hypothetical protein D3870_09840 [Noviherbaspirillum cavernae]|uniref:Uncharacterized protein n=1 Tax=Noviherbaspirillum cavernae TaxID=2320862 RepID=A0A418X1F1_9BURK|nr:hypothetical protein [Noviherbaspirillum cavernae]RJG06274.1 hypothetical protein D3870_09840 [Noviherbaspirillum cavernae]
MIGSSPTNTLEHAIVSGVSHEGLTIKLKDGRSARLAIIDDRDNIIEVGEAVAKEAWNVTLAVYKNFLIGQGHLRVFSSPPGLPIPHAKIAK